MENEDKVQLPLDLGFLIRDFLKEKYDIETNYKFFSKEHLELVKNLKIVQPSEGVLEGIDLLPNLKSLTIETLGEQSYVQPNKRKSINNRDMSYLEKCENLKDLTIINQPNITVLDVEKMKKLESLTVTHNMNLEEIYGLETQENLWELTCYGNEKLSEVNGLGKLIQKNSSLSKLELDVLLFPKAIEYNVVTGKYNEDTIKKLRETCTVDFLESVSTKKTKINLNQMIQMHNKACKILEENDIKGNNLDIIVGIEKYIAKNIKYDYEALEHGHTATSNGIVQGSPKGSNGAYNGLMFNKCVCEGYTRAEQYLLELKGISSHNVHCIAKPDTLHMADNKEYNDFNTLLILGSNERWHSIICIDDYQSLYSDPCWNAGHYQKGDKSMPWLLKNKKEISSDHTLSFGERNIGYQDTYSSSNELFQKQLKNALFITNKTRPGAVKNTQTEIGKAYKGQIIEREEQK